MKKLISKIGTFLFLMVLSLSLFGCSKDENTSKINYIPEDGIIEASKFKEIKDSNDMALFNGEEGKISYQWMFLGSDINEPEDINLLVSFIDKNTEQVKKISKSEVVQGFKFKEDKNIDSKPTLSITLDKSYDISDADIYKYNETEKEISKVCGATVQKSSKTIINFSVLDRGGEFYIVGSDPKSDSDSDSDKDQDSSSKTDDSQSKEEKSKSLKEEMGIDTNPGTPGEDGKDQYLTDPVPEGKPQPVEPEENDINKDNKKYATLSIRCDTLLKSENYKVAAENGKKDMIPSNGVIYKKSKVVFYEGESVFDVLSREVKSKGIHMEFEFTPMYNSAYIEGINNLYEFDGGELSGWMYKVNGWFPNYGCSRYEVKSGDVIEWVYTCDLGRDVGCEWLGE